MSGGNENESLSQRQCDCSREGRRTKALFFQHLPIELYKLSFLLQELKPQRTELTTTAHSTSETLPVRCTDLSQMMIHIIANNEIYGDYANCLVTGE